MRKYIEAIRAEVSSWEGITTRPHRFGGIEFRLIKQVSATKTTTVEIGHLHGNGMIDIPFNTQLRECLVAEGKANPHHMLPETGWVSYFMRGEADVDGALWLLRLSYLHHRLSDQKPSRTVDFRHELANMRLSPALFQRFAPLLKRPPQ